MRLPDDCLSEISIKGHLFIAADDTFAASFSACGGGGKQGDSGQAPPVYVYEVPATTGDNWEVGTLTDVGISESLIEQATQTILDGVYTGIDSFVGNRGRTASQIRAQLSAECTRTSE